MCSTLRDTRKKTLSSHGVVDSQLLRLLPVIYRSRYTGFILLFSPKVTIYDASLAKNKEFYVFAGAWQ